MKYKPLQNLSGVLARACFSSLLVNRSVKTDSLFNFIGALVLISCKIVK